MNGKRILVVDDDETIVESFKKLLKTNGYFVETALSGSEALEKTEKEFYDLALLDIKLPDMKGTELLAEIHEERPRMMKIMVTGHASLDNAVKALNLGADAYLKKPVNPEELLRVVAEKLKKQDDAEKLNEEKVGEWIEDRIKKLESKRE